LTLSARKAIVAPPEGAIFTPLGAHIRPGVIQTGEVTVADQRLEAPSAAGALGEDERELAHLGYKQELARSSRS
jgi:hypothetical protein